jgi:hypothetical protein
MGEECAMVEFIELSKNITSRWDGDKSDWENDRFPGWNGDWIEVELKSLQESSGRGI